jgi:hypothetical protein
MPKTIKKRSGKKAAVPAVLLSRKNKTSGKVSRGIFGLRWKPSLFLIAVFYLFATGCFIFVISRALHATGNDNLATVDFYANASLINGSENSWSGADRVLGAAEVSSSGQAVDFSADNSAVYFGGEGDLICDDFTTEDFIKDSLVKSSSTSANNSAQISSSTGRALEDSLTVSSSTAVSSTIKIFGGEDASSSKNSLGDSGSSISGTAENSSTSENDSSVNLEQVIQDVLGEPAPVEEVQNHLPEAGSAGNSSAADNSSTDGAAESSAESSAQTNSSSNASSDSSSASSAASDSSSSGESSGPVSLINKLKSAIALTGKEISVALSAKGALADSLWGSNADDRNILFGAFKGAKIKISLAAIVQAEEQSKVEQLLLESSSTRAEETASGAPVTIWYSFSDEGDGNVWRELGKIDANILSNSDRGGYLTFDAPFLNDWRDLDSLRLKFSSQTTADSFIIYLDSVWVEISYENGVKKDTEAESGDENSDKLFVDGREINFNWTDDNSDENLIIKSNQKEYYGLTSAEMYFSVENAGVRDENVNFQFYFPGASSTAAKIEELVPHSPYLTQVPKYEAEIYECANGWDKRGDLWTCYPTGEQHPCDEVSPNRRYCRVNGVMTGTEEKIQYADRWQEMAWGDELSSSQEGVFQKLLGLGPQEKTVPDKFKNKKATSDAASVAPGEVKYFKATINFPADSEGEFYLEAIGSSDGYGLLDPWWNSGWNYRLPITLDNTASASTLHDYQVYLEISSSTSRDFWRHIKADGGDIRFANSDETAELPYWIQFFDSTASSAKIWVKADSVPAGAKSRIYLYYGNGGAVSASDEFAPFTYSSLQNIFYTASSSATETINVVSLVDNNQVQLDNGTVMNLSRQQVAAFTGFNAGSVLKAKGPVMAKISGAPALESMAPIAFAGKSFAVPSFRGTGEYSFYSPFAAADVSIADGTAVKQINTIAQNGAGTYVQTIATDSLAIITSNQPVLFSYRDSRPGDGLLGFPAGNNDLYGVKSRYNLIGATAASSFSIFCSDNSSSTVFSLAKGSLLPNQICSGDEQGGGSAVRLGNISGGINAIQQDDGDGSEATMFLPFKEFSDEYMLPTNAAYLAVVCAPETGTVELSVYDQNNNFVSSSTCSGTGDYPGKAYFGTADTATFLAGSRIISTNRKPFYAYYEDTSAGVSGGAETNLYGAVQTRNYAAADLSYAIGGEEIEGPPIGEINSATERADRSGQVDISVSVNDLSRDDCRAKVEYAPLVGGACNFAAAAKATLDETDIGAEFGAPTVNNSNTYQIGTSTGWISTASGTNEIFFHWNTKIDLANATGTYCLRLTANDNISDQEIPATTTIEIDNAVPAKPGNLSLVSKNGTSVTLRFGTTTSDTHFKEYRIYYKQYNGSPVSSGDLLFGSSSDTNLDSVDFNGATTTVIAGLATGMKYDFNLFAYDAFGNYSSSSVELEAAANDAPTALFNVAAEKTDGSGRVDISFTADDINNDNTLRAKLEYQPGSKCDFSSSSLATIDPSSVTATFGSVAIDNDENYQIGTTSHYILTSLGKNTINFVWLSKIDITKASGTYCLRLTANDGLDDQLLAETKVVVLDNIPPTIPGNLAIATTTETSIELFLPAGNPAQDSNEPSSGAYRIFYKQGTSGVTSADNFFTSAALDTYDFNDGKTVTVGGLMANMHYVFNLFAYDAFGNTASATEVTARTDSDLTNKSLIFINPEQSGTTTNIAVADGSSVWNFRAKVSDVDGAAAIDSVTLRLADKADDVSPFDDLRFVWDRSTGVFSAAGANTYDAASISPLSTSACSGNSCQIDYQIIFANTFASTSVGYSGELYSTDASLRTAEDKFDGLFQMRKSWTDQQHYRWRNDNGGG